MTAKSSILTDSEKAVVPTITMRLNLREALEYLKNTGFELSERTYFRYKKKVESMKWQRLIHAANLFTEQHLQRLDKLELVEELMWKIITKRNRRLRKLAITSNTITSNSVDAAISIRLL
jgi:hypothetical protein